MYLRIKGIGRNKKEIKIKRKGKTTGVRWYKIKLKGERKEEYRKQNGKKKKKERRIEMKKVISTRKGENGIEIKIKKRDRRYMEKRKEIRI